MVRVFTPQKSTNAVNQGLVSCFADCLDLRKWWKMLIKQIKCVVSIAVILWKPQEIAEIFLQYLKAIILFSKLAAHLLTNEWNSDICLCYFVFVLFVNVNENINQHWYWNYTHLLTATVIWLCVYFNTTCSIYMYTVYYIYYMFIYKILCT